MRRWEEEKHPRYPDGRFAPRGQGSVRRRMPDWGTPLPEYADYVAGRAYAQVSTSVLDDPHTRIVQRAGGGYPMVVTRGPYVYTLIPTSHPARFLAVRAKSSDIAPENRSRIRLESKPETEPETEPEESLPERPERRKAVLEAARTAIARATYGIAAVRSARVFLERGLLEERLRLLNEWREGHARNVSVLTDRARTDSRARERLRFVQAAREAFERRYAPEIDLLRRLADRSPKRRAELLDTLESIAMQTERAVSSLLYRYEAEIRAAFEEMGERGAAMPEWVSREAAPARFRNVAYEAYGRGALRNLIRDLPPEYENAERMAREAEKLVEEIAARYPFEEYVMPKDVEPLRQAYEKLADARARVEKLWWRHARKLLEREFGSVVPDRWKALVRAHASTPPVENFLPYYDRKNKSLSPARSLAGFAYQLGAVLETDPDEQLLSDDYLRARVHPREMPEFHPFVPRAIVLRDAFPESWIGMVDESGHARALLGAAIASLFTGRYIASDPSLAAYALGRLAAAARRS